MYSLLRRHSLKSGLSKVILQWVYFFSWNKKLFSRLRRANIKPWKTKLFKLFVIFFIFYILMLCFLIHLFILIMFNVGVFCFFFPRRIEICANSSPLFAHASKVHIQKKKKCIYFFWYDAEKAVDTAKLFIFLVYKYNKKLFSFMSNKRNVQIKD